MRAASWNAEHAGIYAAAFEPSAPLIAEETQVWFAQAENLITAEALPRQSGSVSQAWGGEGGKQNNRVEKQHSRSAKNSKLDPALRHEVHHRFEATAR